MWFYFSYAANHILLLKAVAMVSGLENFIYCIMAVYWMFCFHIKKKKKDRIKWKFPNKLNCVTQMYLWLELIKNIILVQLAFWKFSSYYRSQLLLLYVSSSYAGFIFHIELFRFKLKIYSRWRGNIESAGREASWPCLSSEQREEGMREGSKL